MKKPSRNRRTVIRVRGANTDTQSAHNGCRTFKTMRARRQVQVGLASMIGAACDEIDDGAYSVRAVDCRRRPTHDFYALDVVQGQSREIEGATPGIGGVVD